MFVGNSSGSPVFAPEVSSDFASRLSSLFALFPAPTPIPQPPGKNADARLAIPLTKAHGQVL